MSPSSYTLFARKVRGKGWNHRLIRRKFLKQVNKEDYSKSDLPEIINHLVSLGDLV